MSKTQELSQTRVYISGLPSYVTKEQLRSLTRPFGGIVDLSISRSGTGFVEYDTKEAAQYCIHQLNGAVKFSCTLHVDYARARPPREERQSNDSSKSNSQGQQRGPWKNARRRRNNRDNAPATQQQSNAQPADKQGQSAQEQQQQQQPQQQQKQQAQAQETQQSENDTDGEWIAVNKKGNRRVNNNNKPANNKPAGGENAGRGRKFRTGGFAPSNKNARQRRHAQGRRQSQQGKKQKQEQEQQQQQQQPVQESAQQGQDNVTPVAPVAGVGAASEAPAKEVVEYEVLLRNVNTKESEVVARLGREVVIVSAAKVKEFLAPVVKQVQ